MNRHVLALVMFPLLVGCGQTERTGSGSEVRGRYAGIGTFPAGRMWKQTRLTDQGRNDERARLSDDEQIIVVVDSRTGEVRQCGDRSGQCVTMNPWAATSNAQKLPVLLQKHADQLDSEQLDSMGNAVR